MKEAKLELPKFKVIVDTREKQPWTFEKTKYCDGFLSKKLDTADYSILGYENIFAIERKKTVQEIAQNITNGDRFERELERLTKFKYKYIICEFDIHTIFSFPHGSGIPRYLWDKLKISPNYIMYKLCQFQVKYDVHIIYAGIGNGKSVAQSLLNCFFLQHVVNNE